MDFGLAQFLNITEGVKSDSEIDTKREKSENTKKLHCRTRKKSSPENIECKIALPPRPKRRCLAEIQPNAVASRDSLKKPLGFKEKEFVSNKKMPRFGQSCNVENISFFKPEDGSVLPDKFQFMSLTSPPSLANRSMSRRSSSVTIADVFPSIRKYGRVKSLGLPAHAKSKAEGKSCNCFGKMSVCYKCLAR